MAGSQPQSRSAARLRADRRRNIVVLAVCGLLALAFAAFLHVAQLRVTQEVSGIVVRVAAVPGEEKTRWYLRVALESGREVMVEIDSRVPHRRGAQVRLEETRPRIGGRSRYAFRAYGP